ncbi:alpha-2-macroglobulin-like protein 1 isoform X2 [Centruroides vittatus]|uniref:alpha-2-macroglobulin-like protein 1 isoform X2 n=1 Tax=Centruroides vittatus TaxID=120091 RepID=UPI003510CFCA
MHSRLSMLGFRSSLFIFISLLFTQIAEIRCKKNFIVISPKEFDVGGKESLHVTLIDVDTPGKVTIRLINNTGTLFSEVNQDFEKEGSKKVELEVPKDLENEPFNYYRLQVVGKFGDYEFDKNETVTLRNRKELVFLSTDKPFYKAGQTVKFRVFIINSDLKPLKETPVGSVWITDNNRIRIAQWMNITFDNGFIHQELELPDEPVLGTWTLHVQIDKLYTVKYFNVKEYVLPTFEVKIIPPRYFFKDQQNVTWKICAKYTYGKPVQGKLITELKLSPAYYYKPGPTLRNEEEINGCTDITRDIKELYEYREYGYNGLQLFAEITEEGTDTKVNATSNIYPSTNEYTITRENYLQYFRAGIPIRTKVKVQKPDSTPVAGEALRVCCVTKRENWRNNRQMTDNTNTCKTYKTDENGIIVITVPPQPSNTLDISIEVKPEDEKKTNVPNLRFSLSPWFSRTGHNLQIEPIQSAIECGSAAEITVLYTSKESETRKIYYQVASKGDIVDDGLLTYTFDPKDDLSGQTDDTYLDFSADLPCEKEEKWDNKFPSLDHLGKFTLKLDIDFKMSPRARLLLYSVTEDGNVYADSTSFDVKPCFKNQVEMKFADRKQFPGAKTSIHVSAAPQSVCSVGVVDKSVYLLEGGDVLTKSKIYDHLRTLDTSEYAHPYQRTSDYEYCSKKNKSTEPLGFVDAITAFTKSGMMILSDLELETRPCKPSFSWGGRYGIRSCPQYEPSYVALSSPPNPQSFNRGKPYVTTAVSGNGGFGGAGMPGPPGINLESRPLSSEDSSDRGSVGSLDQQTNTVRVYFPETWLWGLYFVDKEGNLFLKENMPDSITEWEGTSVCLHPDAGVGVSDPASIVGFQPFFTSATLPYSVIRGEILPVIVTVFNYLKECLPIQITLDQTDEFELHNGTLISNECVCGDKSVTRRFFIKPKTLGTVNITVTAATVKDEELCENFDVADISRSDSLTKPLIIEAEGFPKEETKNIFFCMEDVEDSVFKAEHELLRSEDLVEGSDRAYVFVTGDVMGPTLEGLERLVRVPTGCGEQNMITLVPNIVVLDYLKSTDRLKEKIRQSAINNIKQGYTRQQKYRHFDGSYSAFGQHDPSGSMWLTAFVARSFAMASKYIDIDMKELERSRNWIISRQLPNGCFPVIGMVHQQQMKGGVKQGNPATLTAYVLASLLLSGNVNESVITKAKECIQAKNNPSSYDLSIFAFTAALTNDPEAVTYLEELNKKAVTEGLSVYWENKDKSISIETASYVILASLRLSDEEHFRRTGPIVRWLSLQRNSYGGFRSTQDTIMAIQALGEYAVRVNRHDLNMGLAVKGNDLDEIFQLNEGNELLTQRTRVPTLPTGIELEAKGQGCALVQVVHRYNVPNTEVSENFVLSIQAQRKQEFCNTASINICASLSKAQNESNMVVLEIKMISGFEAYAPSVQDLLSRTELEVRRFEIKDNQLNLYFVQLKEQNKCFSFDVEEKIVIENRQPAIAKLYDYYNQEESASASYAINDECRISA